jgi:beta-carotene hydroxylase
MSILKYKADRKTLIFVAMYFGLTGLAWVYFAQFPLWLQILTIIILCTSSFICSVIVHNTLHAPIFKRKRLNKLFQIILSTTYGHPVSPFVVAHNFSHHKYTGQPRDIVRTTNMRFRWNFLNQALFLFITSDSIMRSDWLWIKKMWKEQRKKWVFQYAMELIAVIVFKGAFLLFNWKLALLIVWLPHFYAQWGIMGSNYGQHDGCDVTHEYNHSRNFTNKFLNFLVFNNGFHGPHHNHPNMHWSLLPDYYNKKFKQHIHPNLDRNSLTYFLFESCIWPGKRLDYLGNPVVLSTTTDNLKEDWISREDLSLNKDLLGAESLK